MDMVRTALELLPRHLVREELIHNHKPEELRLRIARKPTVVSAGAEYYISDVSVTKDDINYVLDIVTEYSLHTVKKRLLQGFIPYNGLRVGVSGSAVYDGTVLSSINGFTSLTIRIPSEIHGRLDKLVGAILPFENTLIISPPGGGKTTALRELVRILADGDYRVGVIDERGEIALSYDASSVGEKCDVIWGMDKKHASDIMIRCMNPNIIALDEVTKAEDSELIRNIYGCGVKLLFTAHANSIEDLFSRPVYADIVNNGIVKKVLSVTLSGGERVYSLKSI